MNFDGCGCVEVDGQRDDRSVASETERIATRIENRHSFRQDVDDLLSQNQGGVLGDARHLDPFFGNGHLAVPEDLEDGVHGWAERKTNIHHKEEVENGVPNERGGAEGLRELQPRYSEFWQAEYENEV